VSCNLRSMKKERDYCLFINCRKYNRNEGCKKHDNAYGINGGGNETDRLRSDQEFYDYMQKQGDPLARLSYIACRAFGWAFFNYHGQPWRGQLIKKIYRHYILVLLVFSVTTELFLVGCSANFVPSGGPSSDNIRSVAVNNDHHTESPIKVRPITPEVARSLIEKEQKSYFSEVSPVEYVQSEYVLGNGDIIKIVLWETPPALLFGGAATLREGETTVKSLDLPEQRITSEGKISVPFIGTVKATGKTPGELEQIIARELSGKANQPQVFIHVVDNQTKSVTLVGDFEKNTHIPLTSKGERLLDAIAMAGGVRQSVDKVMIQLTRDGIVRSMPFDQLIKDPSQNIFLMPGDVVMAMYQPLSLTVLGAMQSNTEINFETQGITLAQALARAGGLQDQRADASGVFIFRMEEQPLGNDVNPAELNVENSGDFPEDKTVPTLPLPTPVIYTLDISDPASIFLAQNFRMKDKDVLYVSNAPAADLQKFMNIVTSTIYSIRVPISTFR